MNAFITSQFSYDLFVWMSYSRSMNHRITKIREKALILVYKYESDLFSFDLLKKDTSVSIH